MKNSSLAVIIIITLIIAMLTTGIIYAFTSSAPQGAEEPKADAAAESNTETDNITDTAAPDAAVSVSLSEPEKKAEIINNISVDIPGVDKQEFYGLIKAGAVAEMVQSVKSSDMKVEDIKNVYSGIDLARTVGVWDYGEVSDANPLLSSLRNINDAFPIEFMKQIDENTLYVVYKSQFSDGVNYTYMFFEKYEERCNETYESWWHKGNVFYLKKPLEYSDFADIRIGSTTADVHAVDPVVSDRDYPEGYTESFKSYHLMKDGTLTITYSFDTEANRHLVSEMKYNDSFKFAPFGEDSDYIMNVKVDPNDFPAPSSSDVEVK